MFRAFLTIGVMQLFTMLLQVVRTKTLAVLLGSEWIGVMGAVDRLLAVIAQTVSLSFPFAAVRFLPKLWTTDQVEFRRVFTSMRNILWAIVVVATLGAVAVTVWAPQLWGRELLKYRSAVLAGVATLPALAIIPFMQNALAGRLLERKAMTVTLANAAVFAIAAIAGAWWMGLVGFYTLYAIFGLGLIVFAARRVNSGMPAPTHATAPFSLPAPIWRFSTVILGLAFLTPYAALFVYYQVFKAEGPQVAGWMQAAIGVSLIVRVGLGSAHGVFLIPNVNSNLPPQARIAWAYRFQSVLSMIAAVSVPLLVLFPDVFVRILYSADLATGARYAGLFVLAEFIWLAAASCQPLILAFDHLTIHVVQSVAVQLLLVALATLLIPRFGIVGAGVANLVANSALYLSTVVILRVKYGERIPGRVGALTAFVIASIAVAAVIGAWQPTVSVGIASVKLAVYVVLAALLFPFLSPNDRQQLGHIRSRVLARLQPASR
jgi:O-antigen/teichoic acid export membrane protein